MSVIKIPTESKKFFKSNLNDIFKTGNLAEGFWNEKLSEFVSKTTNTKNSVPLCSNGAGLMSLFNYYNHYKNKKYILIQSNTMYGMYTMPISSGLIVDQVINCQINTLMPNFEDVKNAINKSNKKKDQIIIMLSHMGGIINPDIVKISSYCKKNKITLIEDCAHSFGSTLNNKHSGTFGDAGVYSFYSTKAIPAGEGGIVVSEDDKLLQFIKRFTIYDRFEQKMKIGVNIRLSEVQALLIYSVIKNYKHIILNKKKIAQKYIEVCEKYKIPFINQYENSQKGNYYKFVIFNKKQKISKFLPKLNTTTSKIYDYSLNSSKLIPDHHACLPIWYKYETKNINKVISELKSNF